jgi:hypothetical protein
VCNTYASDHRTARRKRFLHHSVYGIDGYRRLASLRTSELSLEVASNDHGPLLGDRFGNHSAGYAWKRKMFHLIENSWHTMWLMMEKASEGKSRLEIQSSNVDASMLF